MNITEFAPEQTPGTIVHRFYQEFLNEGNASAADQLLSPDCLGRGGKVADDIKTFASLLRQGFPDLHFKIQEMVSEDARVAVRWEMEGTHRGPFAGVDPTGGRISHHGMAFYRLKHGKIVEIWNEVDRLGLLQRIGALPPMARVGSVAQTELPRPG